MKTSDYLKTFEGLQFKQNLQIYAIIISTVLNFILTLAVFSKDTIVTITPSTLLSEAEVSEDWGSTSYIEAWALYMSLGLGNVTPENLAYLKPRINPLLSPRVYQTVSKALESQVSEIKDSHVTLYFEPRHVVREPETGKIFVHGQSVMETTTGQRERDERTYEFEIVVQNYMPSFTHILTYEGPPRTIEYINKKDAEAKNRK